MSSLPRAARRIQELQARRDRAAVLFEEGVRQAEVARRLEVTEASVSRWHTLWRRRGARGLRLAGRLGRRSRLNAAQLERLDRALREGAAHHGYATDLWTLPRIADLIHRKLGVHYHAGHVWRVLRRLGWSLQRPTTRARERDEEAIAHWVKQEWPELRKKGAHAER